MRSGGQWGAGPAEVGSTQLLLAACLAAHTFCRCLCRRRNDAVGWGKLERVFVSSMAADNISGLPGMLCTISAAREKGHEAADAPVHVYGPAGIADFIK